MSHAPSAGSVKPSPLVSLGGMIGVATCAVGIAVFLAGCAGYSAAFKLGFLPLFGAAAGFVVTILGGVIRRGGVEQTGVVASLFVNTFALVGGLILFAMSQGTPIFPTGGSMP